MVVGDVGALDRMDRHDRRVARAQRRIAKRQLVQERKRQSAQSAPLPPRLVKVRVLCAATEAARARTEHAEWVPDSKLHLALMSATAEAHAFRRRLLRCRHGASPGTPTFLLDEVGRHGAGIVCVADREGEASVPASGAATECVECELVYIDETVPLFFLTRRPVCADADAPHEPLADAAAAARVGVGAALFEKLCARACKIFGIRNLLI